MSKLKKTIAETPDVPILQKLLGKTIEVIEIVVIVFIALFLASLVGLI